MGLLLFVTLPFLYLVSLLPLQVLHGFSRLLYVMLYRVLGYRTTVVRQNIANAFPKATEERKKEIEKDFYKHLADLFLENIKFMTLSPKALIKRCYFESTELFEHFLEQGQSVIVLMGHCGNWEWSSAAMSLSTSYKLNALFKPTKQKQVDRFITRLRSRFGATLVPRKDVLRVMISEKEGTPSATTFIADQTPFQMNKVEWLPFLNQDTPFLTGYATIAKKFNYPVLFVNVRKPARGQYRIVTRLLFDQPKDHSVSEIVSAFSHQLESEIERQPFNWLWSHRRWKRKRKKS